MSGLKSRVERVKRATHVFVSNRDWQLIADSWMERLAAENVSPDDFEEECQQMKREWRICEKEGDLDKFDLTVRALERENLLAYYACMYSAVMDILRTDGNGSWVPNSKKAFLDSLLELRKRERDRIIRQAS